MPPRPKKRIRERKSNYVPAHGGPTRKYKENHEKTVQWRKWENAVFNRLFFPYRTKLGWSRNYAVIGKLIGRKKEQVKSHAQKEFNKWKVHPELKHFIPPRAGTARDGDHEILAARVLGRSGDCELSVESLENDPLLPADIDVADEDTMDSFGDWICNGVYLPEVPNNKSPKARKNASPKKRKKSPTPLDDQATKKLCTPKAHNSCVRPRPLVSSSPGSSVSHADVGTTEMTPVASYAAHSGSSQRSVSSAQTASVAATVRRSPRARKPVARRLDFCDTDFSIDGESECAPVREEAGSTSRDFSAFGDAKAISRGKKDLGVGGGAQSKNRLLNTEENDFSKTTPTTDKHVSSCQSGGNSIPPLIPRHHVYSSGQGKGPPMGLGKGTFPVHPSNLGKGSFSKSPSGLGKGQVPVTAHGQGKVKFQANSYVYDPLAGHTDSEVSSDSESDASEMDLF